MKKFFLNSIFATLLLAACSTHQTTSLKPGWSDDIVKQSITTCVDNGNTKNFCTCVVNAASVSMPYSDYTSASGSTSANQILVDLGAKCGN